MVKTTFENDIDEAAKRLGAWPDDLRRLIVLASQRNHVLLRELRLGKLGPYAKEMCHRVNKIEDAAYQPHRATACADREAAMRGADNARAMISLQGPVSPDERRR